MTHRAARSKIPGARQAAATAQDILSANVNSGPARWLNQPWVAELLILVCTLLAYSDSLSTLR